MLRGYATEILRELGYQIFEAETGAAALQNIGKFTPEIDLLFTDVTHAGWPQRPPIGRSGIGREADAQSAFHVRATPAMPSCITGGSIRILV